jgi:UDP-N-acetylmuramyl tripeptide synthase
MEQILIIITKAVSFISQKLGLGAGGTWPGEIVLMIYPKLVAYLTSQVKKDIIIVAGTNGKTTTSLMITQILKANGNSVIHNGSGANLLNGIVSAFVQSANWKGSIEADYAVLEVDENTLPLLLSKMQHLTFNKIIVVLLNLFRDQLDRYGEVDVIAEKWLAAIKKLPEETTFVINADDPQLAYLGSVISRGVIYFGIEDKKLFLKTKEHATDSTFCLKCGARLKYSGIYFSHLGVWKCPKGDFARPKPSVTKAQSGLVGIYNIYNALAATATVESLGIAIEITNTALLKFKPAFGRQEEFEYKGKKIKLFLSKNPAGFNASLRTVLELKPSALLLILNDRIPDGRDVSWIWDVDFETIPENIPVIVSGDRTYDLAVRIKYTHEGKTLSAKQKLIVEPELELALNKGLSLLNQYEILNILSTYSSTLEVRKILTGKKIL